MSVDSVTFTLCVLGLAAIVLGLSFHLDYTRRPIVHWSIYTSIVYAGIPLGMGFIMLGLGMQLPTLDLRRLFSYFALFFGVIGMILAFTMPQLITPWWYRHLRENFDDNYIKFVLMPEAALDYGGWLKRTQTMEGLINWTIEVQQRRSMNS